MSQATFSPTHKPILLRIIFILNAFKALLAFGFYAVFTIKGISIGGLDPTLILYTAIGYVATFAALVFFILRKSQLGTRIVHLVDVIISLPAGAYIGIVIAVVSFVIGFHGKVKAYFAG